MAFVSMPQVVKFLWDQNEDQSGDALAECMRHLQLEQKSGGEKPGHCKELSA